MLAICFALATALHGDPFVQNATVQSVGPLSAAGFSAASANVMIPYGQAYGTYDIGHGKMLALLEDASGLPLWVLDAEVYEDGAIDGDLLPLEYVTNPVGPTVMLSVSGQLTLDQDGNGSFHAVAFQYNVIDIPVFPVALIEGVVKSPALGQQIPLHAGLSGLFATRDRSAVGPQLVGTAIVCPKGPDFAILSVQSAGKLAQGGFSKAVAGATLIVDPALSTGTGTGGFGATGVGAMRERAAADHEPCIAPTMARVQLRWWILP